MAKSDNLKKAIGAIDAKILRLEHERKKLTQQLDDLLARVSNEEDCVVGWQPSGRTITVVDNALLAAIAQASNSIAITKGEYEALRALLVEISNGGGGLDDYRVSLWRPWILKFDQGELAALINYVWGGDSDVGTGIVEWLQQCLPYLFELRCELARRGDT